MTTRKKYISPKITVAHILLENGIAAGSAKVTIGEEMGNDMMDEWKTETFEQDVNW